MTVLATGITYDASNGYHVVVVDMGSPSTEARVAAPHMTNGTFDDTADMITVQAHAAEEGATVAVNANYFGGPLNHPCGMGRGFGQQFLDAYGEAVNCVTSLGWASASAQGSLFGSGGHETDANLMAQLTDVVTGGGYLLSGGQPHDWNHAKLEEGRDCTAVGISADRKHLVLVATDSTACTGAGLQQSLLAHGAADAVHLDGGGSTKMWIAGMGYVNDETQDRAPPVAIVARPSGDCPSDCGAALCVQLAKPFRAQCVGQACRGGLGAIWNCDVAGVRRARCENGVVVSEHCGQSCQSMPNGQDDVCVGGTVPEPTPDAGAGDAGSSDAGGGVDASVGAGADAGAHGDASVPHADAGPAGGGGAGDEDGAAGGGGNPAAGDTSTGASSGCTSGGAPGAGSALCALLAPLAVAVARRRRRR
jgi:hypothetical protein